MCQNFVGVATERYAPPHMTPEQVVTMLRARFENVNTVQDRWEVNVGRFRLIVMAHEDTDRLRVMVPIAAVDKHDNDAFKRLLEANFITTLDARYAIYSEVLWALFLGPLSATNDHVFDTACTEVLQLARNTGSSYCAWPAGMSAGFSQLH